MLISIALYIISFPAYVLGQLGTVLQFSLPNWFLDGINNIFHGAGWLNTFLPIYVHAGYGGLAGETGIMPMFGWFLLVIGFVVMIRIAFWLIALLISVLPWNTHTAAPPHNL